MEMDAMDTEDWPNDSSLENFTDPDISNMLQEDKTFQKLLADIENGEVVSGANMHMTNPNMVFGSVESFDHQSIISDSNSSLAGQYSPPFSSASPYGNQYSPSTTSVDSGIPSEFADSPILSPETLSCYDYPSPITDEPNLNDLLMNRGQQPTSLDGNQISPQMLLKLIQQQVQQALIQQQQQQVQQGQAQQTALPSPIPNQHSPVPNQQTSLSNQQTSLTNHQTALQQHLTQQTSQQASQLELQRNLQQQQVNNFLAQQHNSHLIDQTINGSKNDSQLRKMLTQTKNNITQTKNTIIHSLQDKKEKIQRVFPKANTKPGKRKITSSSEDVKMENKVQALCAPQDNIMIPGALKEIPVSAESLEALLRQTKTVAPPKTTIQPPSTVDTNLIQMTTSNRTPQSVSQSSLPPLPRLVTATTPSVASNTSLNTSKISIEKQHKTHHHHSPHHHVHSKAHNKAKKEAKRAAKVAEAKKSRVEHVIIEKRYRMKITDSLNELKIMLPGSDDKKATKNSILQAAIEEIKRLKKQNDTLRRRFDKMKGVFDELRNIGILSQSQMCISSSSSDSSVSDDCTTTSENTSSASDATNKSIEPEVNQDHYASPFQRQSAKDGAKVMTCFALFAFLIFNPLSLFAGGKGDTVNAPVFSSRHLLGVRGEQDASPGFSLFSTLVNVFSSLFILMVMLLRGNPRCEKNSKLTQCFRSQFRKAQKRINKGDYHDAKSSLRIALFVIGNSCPKTFHGMLASFAWKCVCHMLYQLGILTALESIGNSILPAAVSCRNEKEQRQFAAKLSAKAYKKLHEIALKDSSSTYMESACYIMNAIYAAEVSNDKEALCTLYATAVVHMRERLWTWLAPFPEYYFLACAHHASLASKDGVFAVDWIFENRGYAFFVSSIWDINRGTVFNATDDESKLDANDLLQIVFVQFQEHLLSKALKRIIVPDTFYPNEGKIELRQRAISYLESLGTGPVSEQIDPVSLHYQSLYFWWGFTLKQLLNVCRDQRIEDGEYKAMREMFEEIPLKHRNPLFTLAEGIISNYIYIRNMKYSIQIEGAIPLDLKEQQLEIQEQLEASASMVDNLNEDMQGDGQPISSNKELEELIFIMCCGLMIETNYLLWQYDSHAMGSEQELSCLINENHVLHSYAMKYPELAAKVQAYDQEIQCMSGSDPSELSRMLKKTQHIKASSCQHNPISAFYMQNSNIPIET
ncbi:sterol regulatory element-binding protein 2-like [Clytia hemisphaerica]|uniref:BHLH domain-containing protein n=1 Tax=Clytia hemisphaerica TaxID=252671 RepID=A0A7M5X8P6_9CNID